MTYYAGHQTSIEISEANITPSFAPLKALRTARWRLEHAFNESEAIRDDNWVRYAEESAQRRLTLQCELYGASHVAQARIRTAALQGGKLRAKMTLATGTILESDMLVERYEVLDEEDALMEVEVSLVSTGTVTITG